MDGLVSSVSCTSRTASMTPRLRMMSGARRPYTLFVLCGIAAFGSVTRASASQDEYLVKAAFILNFAKLIEWPPTAQPPSSKPFVLGVMASQRIEASISEGLAGATLGTHPIAVRPISTASDVVGCQIIFLTSKRNEQAILDAARREAALSVGESDGFAARGGMINFIREGNKLRFEINTSVAEQAGLKISSRLLQLARLVETP
jgi:YfiR/HmsC-like